MQISDIYPLLKPNYTLFDNVSQFDRFGLISAKTKEGKIVKFVDKII